MMASAVKAADAASAQRSGAEPAVAPAVTAPEYREQEGPDVRLWEEHEDAV